jgi:phosphodiesterase/alkaline phosphatase D-like protein
MAEPSPPSEKLTTLLLGPFVGNITHSSVRIWLNVEVDDADKNVFVTLKHRRRGPKSEAAKKDPSQVDIQTIPNPVVVQSGVIKCLRADLGTGIVDLGNLEPNSEYSYQLWQDEAHSIELDLNPPGKDGKSISKDGLKPEDLFFWTLPEDGYGRQLDFLLMSCHHPETKKQDGFDGFAVWHQIPEIIDGEQNANVRFAILAGDQIYADEIETQALKESDGRKRQELYLSVYKNFWDNVDYRRVLCRVPAVLMWDDHDITDGWGSREDSFEAKDSSVFQPEWRNLFETAKEMFRIMQASRNPEPLSKNFADGFDTCFKVGKAGFVVADLRSNRNIRQFNKICDGKKVWIGQIWLPTQLDAIKKWVATNKKDLDTLFFVSSVVFSHGAPLVEQYILKIWFWVIDGVNWAGRLHLWKKQLQKFNDKVGDLRDDINDSWGSAGNRKEADRALDFLFELENPPDGKNPLNVVILSGDIHTPGYSTIYSSNPSHKKKAIIPHIVATPVAYEPFSWVGEAIFRHLTKVVALGEKKVYTSQVSHHFCYRNVVVVSLRNYEEDESHLKVKYYLEGFPEPQVMLFDLNHGAHREDIGWPLTVKPKSFLDKLLFWRKDKSTDAIRKSESVDTPVAPFDFPENPPI